MRAKSSFLPAFIVGLVAVAALAAAGQPALAAKHHKPTAPIVVDENDYGATIQVTVGQHIEVMLQDPGYGGYGRYGWKLSDVSSHAVKYSGHGSGGSACWRMRAAKEGSATCTLVCEPPPWLMLPARQFQVTFDVQPPAE